MNVKQEKKVGMLRELIASAKENIFYVEFFKADGSLRKMVALQQSPDGPKGEGRATGDATHDLVFDAIAQGYRTINLLDTRLLAVGQVLYRDAECTGVTRDI